MIWWMWKVLHSLYFIFLDPWLELLGLKAIKRFPNLSSFSFLPDMNREASRMASPRSRTVINSSLPAYSPSQGVEATTGNNILDRVRSCQYMSVQYLLIVYDQHIFACGARFLTTPYPSQVSPVHVDTARALQGSDFGPLMIKWGFAAPGTTTNKELEEDSTSVSTSLVAYISSWVIIQCC